MRKLFGGLVTAFVLVFLVGVTSGGEKADKYVGMVKCKTCHRAKIRGQQFQKWVAGPHAKAYEVLGTDKAKAVAKKAGVKGSPQEAAECLTCHVTAYNVADSLKAATYKMEEGITCEACHGPGSSYFPLKVMKALYERTTDAASVGLTRPNEAVCKTCHNK